MEKIELKGGIDVPVKASSSQWSVNWRDVIQSSLLAGITGGLNAVYATLDAGSLDFNWRSVAISASIVFLGNILRKLPQSSKVILEKEAIKEAKK
jgi:hypothetical protein